MFWITPQIVLYLECVGQLLRTLLIGYCFRSTFPELNPMIDPYQGMGISKRHYYHQFKIKFVRTLSRGIDDEK